MRVKLKNSDVIIGKDIRLADSFFFRLKGLMFDKEIKGDGLLIRPCRSIHTFFMNFPIDAVFLDADGKVIKILRKLKAWRITPFYFKARQVLELPDGGLSPSIKEGDYLIICLN